MPSQFNIGISSQFFVFKRENHAIKNKSTLLTYFFAAMTISESEGHFCKQKPEPTRIDLFKTHPVAVVSPPLSNML